MKRQNLKTTPWCSLRIYWIYEQHRAPFSPTSFWNVVCLHFRNYSFILLPDIFFLRISQTTSRHEPSVNLTSNSKNVCYALRTDNKVQVPHARATHNSTAAPSELFISSLPTFQTFSKMGLLYITHIKFTVPEKTGFVVYFTAQTFILVLIINIYLILSTPRSDSLKSWDFYNLPYQLELST